MQAIILAGGKGTRLRPYTTIFPKPLMPIDNHPILEIVVKQLVRYGFERATLATGHLSELIEAYFGDGGKWGLKIGYSREEKPLGTAAPLKLVEKRGGLDEHFLVMNGDVLTDLDYRAFLEDHSKSGAAVTIASYKREVQISLGVLESDENHMLRDYIEKPVYRYEASMGVYGFTRRALSFIPEDAAMDFPDLIKRLLAQGEKVRCHPFAGYWLDIGRSDDYQQAVEEFTQLRSRFLGE